MHLPPTQHLPKKLHLTQGPRQVLALDGVASHISLSRSSK